MICLLSRSVNDVPAVQYSHPKASVIPTGAPDYLFVCGNPSRGVEGSRGYFAYHAASGVLTIRFCHPGM